MALIGYGRVSSTGQSLEVQIEQLKAAGVDELFTEKKTGTSRDAREQLEAALRFARKGDVLCVTKMDRLARSVADLSAIVTDLDSRGIGFRVLDQAGVDTTTPSGRLLMHTLSAFAEFETAIRKERQLDGVQKAKANGVYKGRPAKLPAHRVIELHKEGMGATEIAKTLGIARASVYRFINANKEVTA